MVIVYTTSTCPYCNAAKDLLRRKGVAFREIDVSDDAEFDALIKRTGWKTVPQVFIGEKMIGGYRELTQLEANGKLDGLLREDQATKEPGS
jgi:glutaredoxin 3